MSLADFGLIETKAKAIVPGERYGRLFVVTVGQVPDTYRYYAICWCDCNSGLKSIQFAALKSGAVVSCGCYHKEVVSSHNLSKHRYYSRWSNMMDRCYSTECEAYSNYGGRGIKVCSDWHDVAKYIEQLPHGYFEGAHLDRIDNDGDYEPANVRWATPKQNHDNRRSGVMLTHDGRTQSMTAWGEEAGIAPGIIWARINEHGWPIEKALTTPTLSDAHERMKRAHEFRWKDHVKAPPPLPMNYRMVEWEGETIRLSELAKRTGISRKTLSKRIFERGWPVDRAVAKG